MVVRRRLVVPRQGGPWRGAAEGPGVDPYEVELVDAGKSPDRPPGSNGVAKDHREVGGSFPDDGVCERGLSGHIEKVDLLPADRLPVAIGGIVLLHLEDHLSEHVVDRWLVGR